MRNALTHFLRPAVPAACLLACVLAIAAGFGPLARVAPAHIAHAAPARATTAHAAQRIYIDLATGGLRAPTPAELAAEAERAATGADTGAAPGAATGTAAGTGLQAVQKAALAGAAASADSAAEVHLADGTVGVRPARQFLHSVELCRQPDGGYGERCADAGGAR